MTHEIITTDRYRHAFPDLYFKTDEVYWRRHPPRPNLPILITGHSDYGVTDELVDLYKPRVWFTVNKQTDRPNVFALPIGITNDTTESVLHPVYGNLECMAQVMGEEVPRVNLAYMNFDIKTYPEERSWVWNHFKGKPWVSTGTIEPTIEGRTKFLREMKAHAFVICPRGNGLDTHRLWETLYMGSIPIVKRDKGNLEFQDMPICFVEGWEQVTEEFLKREEVRLRQPIFSLEKLKMSYWVNRISSLRTT